MTDVYWFEHFQESFEYYLFTLLLVLGIFFYALKSWLNPLKDLPGPRGWPILGNTLEFTSSTDQHALLLKWTKEYGRIFKYYILFGGYRVHITDPGLAKYVLVSNCKNYRRQDVLKKLLPGFGNGLITSNGQAHAIQRKQLNPFFSLGKVQQFLPLFLRKTNQLIKRWREELMEEDSQSIECDVLERLTHLSLDIIGLSAFGYDFDCILVGETDESKATDIVLKGQFDLQKRSLELMFPPLRFLRSKIEEEFCKAEKCLQRLIEKVIYERQTSLNSDKETSKCSSLLTMLFEMKNENGEQLSPKDLYHQVFTFLVSGHETISLTATWTLYLLSKYQKIQSDLRREIKEVISDREIIWEDMDKLKLLDNCIKEALRLYPIALTTDRTSIGPDKLGTFSIPAGTHVMIGNGTLQRDERFWKDPNAFRPSRFDEISDQDRKLLPYYFLPFSRGPRMCIGYRFAMAALKVILAKTINDFSFSFKDGDYVSDSIPEFNSISTLTLKPCPPFILKMKAADREIEQC